MIGIVIHDMDRHPFIVDFNDPSDIARKLAEAERILDETNRKLAEVVPLQRKAQEWQVNVEFLRSKVKVVAADIAQPSVNGTTTQANDEGRAKVQDYVVEVVNRQMRKIKASLVRDILLDEGHDFSAEQVSNALHHAATGPKLIQKWPERGMYAPLGCREAPLPAQEPWPASPITLTAGGVLPGT
jgi:hypothetical protein